MNNTAVSMRIYIHMYIVHVCTYAYTPCILYMSPDDFLEHISLDMKLSGETEWRSSMMTIIENVDGKEPYVMSFCIIDKLSS